MPISVSRKLQALRHPELNIQVHHVALTLSQVREYGLPSTPLSETERRENKWRRVMGHEQTEIDALAALRPEILKAIARDAIKPFWDETLNSRTWIARNECAERANEILEAHPDYAEARDTVESALKEL